MNSRKRFLAACNLIKPDRPPVWIMRQAGRYLPEYRELRQQHSFLEICKSSDLITAASLQPWKRFGVDAVIVFSDILLPISFMGPKLQFDTDLGPKFEYPIRTKGEIDGLDVPKSSRAMPFLFESIQNIQQLLNGEAALIGFIGSPWTLACYLIEGGSGAFNNALEMLKQTPSLLSNLLDKITDAVIDHALEQIRTGCDIIQIFDTWGGLLSSDQYQKFSLPFIKKIIKEIHHQKIPSILFVKQSSLLINDMINSNAKVISIGSNTLLKDAIKKVGARMGVQGNLDPEILLKSKYVVEKETKNMLKEANGFAGYIANLGHGILPQTPLENVFTFIKTIQGASASST